MKVLKRSTSSFLQGDINDVQELFAKNNENKVNKNVYYSKFWTGMTYPG